MKENRSLFWPLSFIAAGALWLMINMNLIPAGNLWALTHIWPYVLIALGVGLILRSFWRPFGTIVSALVVIGAFAAVFYAPQLGWAGAPEWGVGDSFTGAVPGSGRIESETRKVTDFDAISIRYPAEVVILQGEKESLIIEADDNLLPQLSTKVSSGTLVIENNEDNWADRVNPSEAVQVTITVRKLTGIKFSSAGTLLVEDLESDELEFSISRAGEVTLTGLEIGNLDISLSGAGTIHADGVAENVSISISGLGNFEGEGLASQTADIEISGAGNATLRVEKQLTAKISGAGSVNYYGDPEVSQRISGAGAVKKAGD
jgi:hypothetical protein